jgi:hypothetical protein
MHPAPEELLDAVSGAPFSWEVANRRRLEAALGPDQIWTISSCTVIALPSLSLGQEDLLAELGSGAEYEERLLFSLLFLREPGVRVVYLSSGRLPDSLVRYYLSHLPEGAADRLTLLPAYDDRSIPLTRKVLESERVMRSLEQTAKDSGNTVLLPLDATRLEQSLGDKLNVGVFGPEPRAIPLGTKTGGRRLARGARVPLPEGVEDLASAAEVERALKAFKKRRPDVRRAVVKLNDGFSGRGNAIVDLKHFSGSLNDHVVNLCDTTENWAGFAEKIAAGGAIAEEFLDHPNLTFPSVQLCISTNGRIDILSTQEQRFGGTTSQTFTGCAFPAGADYRQELHRHSLAISRLLRDAQVYGFFGIDFMVAPLPTGPQVFFGEINLRMGGTTAPALLTKLVTQSDYRLDSGTLSVKGKSKCYSATDGLRIPARPGVEADFVMDSLAAAGLLYRSDIGRGVLPYGMAGLEDGRLSIVCLADSHEQVEVLSRGVESYLQLLEVGAA